MGRPMGQPRVGRRSGSSEYMERCLWRRVGNGSWKREPVCGPRVPYRYGFHIGRRNARSCRSHPHNSLFRASCPQDIIDRTPGRTTVHHVSDNGNRHTHGHSISADCLRFARHRAFDRRDRTFHQLQPHKPHSHNGSFRNSSRGITSALYGKSETICLIFHRSHSRKRDILYTGSFCHHRHSDQLPDNKQRRDPHSSGLHHQYHGSPGNRIQSAH